MDVQILLVAILVLIVFDLIALRYGADSREDVDPRQLSLLLGTPKEHH